MKKFWDERYAEAEYAYGTAPNEYLESEHNAIPVGKVLCLAEGEGRNSVFLAKQGYTVFAVDQSSVGLAKTQRLSLESDVIVDITEADLEVYNIEPSSWDGIVSISAHLAPSLRKRRNSIRTSRTCARPSRRRPTMPLALLGIPCR